MSGLNVIFSKLDKFTGNGNADLRQWLRKFEHCCVIAEKKDEHALCRWQGQSNFGKWTLIIVDKKYAKIFKFAMLDIKL